GSLDRRAQRRLVLGERLADAVLDRTGLSRKAAAGNGADHVVLALAAGDLERLVDDQSQSRTGEEHYLVATVDGDLAGARLEPHAGDGVLAAAGRVGAALRVELLFAQRGVRDLRRLGLARRGRQRLPVGEIGDGAGLGRFGGVVGFRGHHLAALFLRLSEATSSVTGWLPACGCSLPALRCSAFICWRPSGLRVIIRSTAFSSTRSGKRPSSTLSAVIALIPPG